MAISTLDSMSEVVFWWESGCVGTFLLPWSRDNRVITTFTLGTSVTALHVGLTRHSADANISRSASAASGLQTIVARPHASSIKIAH